MPGGMASPDHLRKKQVEMKKKNQPRAEHPGLVNEIIIRSAASL
jgi:hypothetical protein